MRPSSTSAGGDRRLLVRCVLSSLMTRPSRLIAFTLTSNPVLQV